MSTGYDTDGAQTLVCIAPPNAGTPTGPGSPATPRMFTPSAITAVTPQNVLVYPTYAFNLADFSVEWWFRWAEGDAMVGADVFQAGPCLLSLTDDVTEPDGVWPPSTTVRYFRPIYENTDYGVSIELNTLAALGGDYTTAWLNFPVQAEGGWAHMVVNVDRDGNMTTYFNTVLIDTTNIAAAVANSMGTLALLPPGGENHHRDYNAVRNWDDNALGSTFFDDWSQFDQLRAIHGPWAIHNRLLTAAERLDSFQSRRVQNLGAAVTVINIDPREIVGVTGWDFDPDHMQMGHRSACFGGIPTGMPQGALGSVVLRDQSGNGRDLPLPTRTTYADLWHVRDTRLFNGATDVRAWCVFIADPFWV